jgi:hypothetical protein
VYPGALIARRYRGERDRIRVQNGKSRVSTLQSRKHRYRGSPFARCASAAAGRTYSRAAHANKRLGGRERTRTASIQLLQGELRVKKRAQEGCLGSCSGARLAPMPWACKFDAQIQLIQFRSPIRTNRSVGRTPTLSRTRHSAFESKQDCDTKKRSIRPRFPGRRPSPAGFIKIPQIFRKKRRVHAKKSEKFPKHRKDAPRLAVIRSESSGRDNLKIQEMNP